MTRVALDDPRLYLNRHLQWMAFNHRVLEEARDPGTPLLERVKFLAITANNLDEFVEIRVSSFLQKIEHGGQSVSERISKEILSSYLADNRKARFLGPDGQYTHVRRGRNGKSFSVQEHLMVLASGNVNGSGRPRELHRAVTLTKGEQAAPTPPTEPSKPATQESSHATV